MVDTRLDIAFALRRLSQYMTKQSNHNDIVLHNLMRYRGSTIEEKYMLVLRERKSILQINNSYELTSV
jgi:hypothetical protein